MLAEENCRLATVIPIKMLTSDGRNSIQRHLREHLSKIKKYDLEEELYAELCRREAEGDKPGGLNELQEPEKIEKEKNKDDWPEEVWQHF